MKHCDACGMPMINKENFALGDENCDFCCYCTNIDGSVKTCKEIFDAGVKFFMGQFGDNKNMAEKITRKNMSRQPYWQGKECECLKGEIVSDEEFAEVMKNMA